jgi:hypothetical protein
LFFVDILSLSSELAISMTVKSHAYARTIPCIPDDTIYDMQVSVKSRETWLHSSAIDFEAIVSNLAEELSGNHQAANVTSYVTAQR